MSNIETLRVPELIFCESEGLVSFCLNSAEKIKVNEIARSRDSISRSRVREPFPSSRSPSRHLPHFQATSIYDDFIPQSSFEQHPESVIQYPAFESG
jgi:hypothetical protein